MNARCRSREEYIAPSEDITIPELSALSELYQSDSIATFPRNNTDMGTNTYGDRLIDLCRTTNLRFLNGKKVGDLLGFPTCFTPNGFSTVDYGLVSPRLFYKIDSFKVDDPNLIISDHAPISVCLKLDTAIECNNDTNYNYLPKPGKVIWNKSKSFRYKILLQSPACKEVWQGFIKTGIKADRKSIDAAATFVADIMVSTAEAAEMSVKRTSASVPKRNKRSHPSWHDQSCHEALKKVQASSSLLKSRPNNAWLRGKLMTEKKQYKFLIRQKQKQHLNDLFLQLDSLHNTDPRGYMQLVKSIKNNNHDTHVKDDTNAIRPKDWHTHFSNLLSQQPVQSEAQRAKDIFVEQNMHLCDPVFNLPFTKTDLRKVISRLKNNKASSFDMVCNEMIKTGSDELAEPLLLLFNSVHETGIYPSQWKQDILQPLHKSGD